MTNKNQNIISGSLRLIKECPVCNTKYNLRRLQVIDFSEDGFLVYFSCPVCLSSLLAQITEAPFGLVGSAMLTDLEAEEIMKFRNGERVNYDDVLEIYQNLK